MKISRTPLRISFLGGGTDYPQWYKDHPGAVLGTAIDKYCYVMLHDGKSWRTFDLPTKAGLGSSSAYTVGLLRVCTELDQLTISKLATTWEFDKMNGSVGSQDQFLCAIGGFHLLRFSEHGIKDTPVSLDAVRPLEKYLLLFDTHQYRRAGDIVVYQLRDMDIHADLFASMAEMVDSGFALLKQANFVDFGKLLHESWLMKRQLSDYVSTPTLDAIYEEGLKAGAIGGKVLGGGGGGFILFLAEPDRHEGIRQALSALDYVPFQFENGGTKVIYDDRLMSGKSQ